MLIRFCIAWAVCAALPLCAEAAEPPLPSPLAFASAPPCSKRPGIRAIRSDLIQAGDVTASLSAQAAREGESCVQSAALWLTRKGVSQQYEFRDAGINTFAILDIASDSKNILLSSVAAFPNPEDDHSAQLAILPLVDGTLRWIPIDELLNLKNCDASFEPQGFLDADHILITALPLTSARKHPNCVTQPVYYSYDLITHKVKASVMTGVSRFAQSVAGPVRSCKSDPDVVAACYTARARLSVTDGGDGLTVWPVGGTHIFSVEEGMLPNNLSSRVSASMRVYATMVICPLTVEHPGLHQSICVDAATEFHPDPSPSKSLHAAASAKGAVPATGQSH